MVLDIFTSVLACLSAYLSVLLNIFFLTFLSTSLHTPSICVTFRAIYFTILDPSDRFGYQFHRYAALSIYQFFITSQEDKELSIVSPRNQAVFRWAHSHD